jgi:hypothetical protein
MVHKGLYRVMIYGCNRGGDGMAMCYDVLEDDRVVG